MDIIRCIKEYRFGDVSHATGYFDSSNLGVISDFSDASDSLIVTCSNDQSIKVWNSDLSPVNSFENTHASFIYSMGLIHDLPSLKQSFVNKRKGKITHSDQLG